MLDGGVRHGEADPPQPRGRHRRQQRFLGLAPGAEIRDASGDEVRSGQVRLRLARGHAGWDGTPEAFERARYLDRCMVMCMRTNIEIDDEVLREAQRLLGTRTKRETVDMALRELVARHRRIGVLNLRGRVRWEGDLEESRRGRS